MRARETGPRHAASAIRATELWLKPSPALSNKSNTKPQTNSPHNPNKHIIPKKLGPHFTNKGIELEKVFSVNIPGKSLFEKTDYCGLVSGSKIDKSKIFDVFYGDIKTAPLIKECPICMACKLTETVKLPSNTLYIGEIVEAYSESCYLTDGKPDVKKINPFTLTMPDNNYWEISNNLGKAWNVGNKLKQTN